MGFADDFKESIKYAKKQPENTTPTLNSNNDETGANTVQHVEIVDIRIPFWSLVWFMVKWAFATIPAVLIICLIYLMCLAMFGMVGTAILR